MYKKILFILIFLLFTTNSYANLYVIVDKTTKEIYSTSENNSVAIPEGKELVTLPGGYANYELAFPATEYKFDKGKFVLNQAKINAEEARKEVEKAAQIKLAQDKESAKDKLKALGLTDDEVTAILK